MPMTAKPPEPDLPIPLLQTIMNLARFHREHEKYYATAPREQAVALQRSARTLQCWPCAHGRSLTQVKVKPGRWSFQSGCPLRAAQAYGTHGRSVR
jgi:hypothetical protein